MERTVGTASNAVTVDVVRVNARFQYVSSNICAINLRVAFSLEIHQALNSINDVPLSINLIDAFTPY